MWLDDLLVSYKQVLPPLPKEEKIVIEEPLSISELISKFKTKITEQPISEKPIEQPISEDKQEEPIELPILETILELPIRKTVKGKYSDRSKWTKDLKQAYIKAGVTNENALKILIAQDALESAWGKSIQGSYNFGNITTGSSWKGKSFVGNDKDAKGNPIKLKFRAYNSIDEYAKDKVLFLTKLYGFDLNDNIDVFASKLIDGKRKYAESPEYKQSLKNVYASVNKFGGKFEKARNLSLNLYELSKG